MPAFIISFPKDKLLKAILPSIAKKGIIRVKKNCEDF